MHVPVKLLTIRKYCVKEKCSCAAWSPDGKMVAVGTEGSKVAFQRDFHFEKSQILIFLEHRITLVDSSLTTERTAVSFY